MKSDRTSTAVSQNGQDSGEITTVSTLLGPHPGDQELGQSLLLKVLDRLVAFYIRQPPDDWLSPQAILVSFKAGNAGRAGANRIDRVDIDHRRNQTGAKPQLIERYVSPEFNDKSLSRRQVSDIYVLGFIFYEFFLGAERFQDTFKHIEREGGPISWLTWHTDETKRAAELSSLLPEFPEKLSYVIARMIEKRPEERYQNFQEVKTDLNSSTRFPEPDRTGEDQKGNKAKITAIILAIMALALLGLFVTALFNPPGQGVTTVNPTPMLPSPTATTTVTPTPLTPSPTPQLGDAVRLAVLVRAKTKDGLGGAAVNIYQCKGAGQADQSAASLRGKTNTKGVYVSEEALKLGKQYCLKVEHAGYRVLDRRIKLARSKSNPDLALLNVTLSGR